MKRFKLLACFFALTLILTSANITAADIHSDFQENLIAENMAYAPDQLLVKFASNTSETAKANVRNAFGLSQKSQLDGNIEVLTTKGNNSVESLITALSKNRHIEVVQPNYRYEIPKADYTAFRPELDTLDLLDYSLWGMDLIDAASAWTVSEGDGVVVAVIDTGIMTDHEDLQGNMWVNTGEANVDGLYKPDGIDNDGNGYEDDIYGWNVLDENGDVFEENYFDSDGYYGDAHGTHVAGTIAGIGNTVGVIGAAPQAKIMALKFFGSHADSGYTDQAIEAITYASDNGAQVINASWGGGGSDPLLKEAIEAFDGVFVAASGNGDWRGRAINNDRRPHYPSSYDSPNIIAVASVDNDYGEISLSSFSNYGEISVDIAAPGGIQYYTNAEGEATYRYINSCYPYASDGDFKYIGMAGTSMAAPHVTGVIALLLSTGNYDTLAPTDIIDDLLTTAVPDRDLDGKIKSGGYLNAFNAVTYRQSLVQYDLTVSVNGGTGGSVSPTSGTYDDGTVVSITAVPDTGYVFDYWAGDVADTVSSTTTVTMDEDQTVTAHFRAAATYTLSVSAGTGGTVSPTGGTYYEGTEVDLSATPDTDYAFAGWTGDISTVADPASANTTVVVNANLNIAATFVEDVTVAPVLTGLDVNATEFKFKDIIYIDAYVDGDPLSGHTVNFTIIGNTTLLDTNALTDSTGKASASLRVGRRTPGGDYTVFAHLIETGEILETTIFINN